MEKVLSQSLVNDSEAKKIFQYLSDSIRLHQEKNEHKQRNV